jgi:hypothetical protein
VKFTKKLEFGNYTLNFGSEKVLLDLFEDIVMPSFEEKRYKRIIQGKSDYFFIDTKLVVLDENAKEPVLGISGKIIKNSKLKRDQVYRDDEGIVEDIDELETAPSSVFLLILNTHRLVFCKEVQGAPTIQNFKTTSENFLKKRYKEFIREKFDDNKIKKTILPGQKRITLKSLVEETPPPVLRITTLSDEKSLKTFINMLKTIDRVSIKLLQTNNEELDNDDFWTDAEKIKEEMNSDAVKVEFSNFKDGLDKERVFQQTNLASSLANSEIKMRGYDNQGDTIKGSHDDFSLTLELEELPKNAETASKIQYNQFMHLVNNGIVKIPKLAESTIKKIIRIFGIK